MNGTLRYYETHAREYAQRSAGADMSMAYGRFLKDMPEGGSILDAGCGSGRDSKVFSMMGFEVTAFDESRAMVRIASEKTGLTVQRRRFGQVTEIDSYDGVWACASLLHLDRVEVREAVKQLWRALRPAGRLYMSFKKGDGEAVAADGRLFCYFSERSGMGLMDGFLDLNSVQAWTNKHALGGDDEWISVLATKSGYAMGREAN